jgi:3'(2'), 5'-bisphosphate nucleotidase
MKRDGSPVTSADLASHEILRAGCHMLAPAIPVISEEDAPACERDNCIPPVLLAIDPLDGTKEFIEDRDEFAINVALVENGRPTAGLIFAPALGRLLFSYGPRLAFEQTAAGRRHWLPTVSRPRHNPIVLVSRSHRDPQTDAFVAALQPCDVKAIGSSLKFALVATGEADFYPRLAPTMIWDCAAGQAIVEAAGGAVLRPNGQPLSWTEDTAPRVDGFIAAGTKSLTARLIDVLHAVKA